VGRVWGFWTAMLLLGVGVASGEARNHRRPVSGKLESGANDWEVVYIVPRDSTFEMSEVSVAFHPDKGHRLADPLCAVILFHTVRGSRQQGHIIVRGAEDGHADQFSWKVTDPTVFAPRDTIWLAMQPQLSVSEGAQWPGWPQHTVRWKGILRAAVTDSSMGGGSK
jgi:hypothetical protein